MTRTTTAVVAAYKPGKDFKRSLEAISALVSRVIVVDDGSGSDYDSLYSSLTGRKGLVLSRRSANGGIAVALNEGLRLAFGRDETTDVLMFDQDSVPGSDYLKRLLTARAEASRAGHRVALTAAGRVNGVDTRSEGQIAGGRIAVEVIQSGTLLSRATFHALGPLDESFIIDAVDSEYSLRARASGFINLSVPTANLQHALGEPRVARIAGRILRWRESEVMIVHHSPTRQYYMVRNRVRLYRTYARSEPKWVARSVYTEGRAAAMNIFLGGQVRAQMRAASLGFMDGIRGHTGLIDDKLGLQLSQETRRGLGARR